MQQCPEVRSLGKCWGPEDKSRRRAATSRGPGFVSQQRQGRPQLSLSPFRGNQTPCYGCMHVVHRCRCSQNTHAYKPKQNGSRKSVNRYFRGPFVNRWKWPISIGLLQYHWWSGCPRQNAKVRHCGFRLLDNVLGENLIWESEGVSISTLLICRLSYLICIGRVHTRHKSELPNVAVNAFQLLCMNTSSKDSFIYRRLPVINLIGQTISRDINVFKPWSLSCNF